MLIDPDSWIFFGKYTIAHERQVCSLRGSRAWAAREQYRKYTLIELWVTGIFNIVYCGMWRMISLRALCRLWLSHCGSEHCGSRAVKYVRITLE